MDNENKKDLNSKDTFTIEYLVDYSTFCKANDLEDANQLQKERFINDILFYYGEEAPVEEVRRFFMTKDTPYYNKKLEKREYKITYKVTGNDTTNHKIKFNLTLKFDSDIILPS